MTKKALLLVSTSPASEADAAEFDRWYSEVHIPQVLERVPGFVAATRYKVHEASLSQPDQKYVTAYEIEAEDIAAAHAALLEATGAGRLDSTTTLQLDPPPTMSLLALVSEHRASEAG